MGMRREVSLVVGVVVVVMVVFGVSEFSEHGGGPFEGCGEVVGFHCPAHDVGCFLHSADGLVEECGLVVVDCGCGCDAVGLGWLWWWLLGWKLGWWHGDRKSVV